LPYNRGKVRRYAAYVIAGAVVSLGVVAAFDIDDGQTVWDGVYTEEQARQGAVLYATHCASCHGDGLGGVETAPALTGVSFSATWDGVPLADLFERMRTSMPPGKSGVVPRQGYADILAFILERAGMPAGTATLASERAALLRVRFVSYRP
jgi:S-disulfanyl-L-cysteine oxidoreductase SoxD